MNKEKSAQFLRLQSLGSSSKGNCTYVWDERTQILIDCGFAPSYLRNALQRHGKTLRSINAVLITHVHGDHIYPPAVNDLMRLGVGICCHEQIAEPLFRRYGRMFDSGYEKNFRIISEDEFAIGDMHARAFEVPHDSEGGCFGYTVTKPIGGTARKLALATDIAHTGNGTAVHFINSDIIVIESNHDIDMLDNSGRPVFLKNRIKETGHLSNEQCADFLVEVLGASEKLPAAILLAHISQDCNTNAQALRTVQTALAENGFGKVKVLETFMDKPSAAVGV